MSKKTNALLYRFGISTLWANKSVRKKTESNAINLERLLYKELRAKKLQVILIAYKTEQIIAFVHNTAINSIKLKRLILKYYLKVDSCTKVVNKFGLSLGVLLKYILESFLKNYQLKSKLHHPGVLRLFCYKYLLEFYLSRIYYTGFSYSLMWLFKFLSIFQENFYLITTTKKLATVSTKYLRKKNSLLKFKIIGFKLENILVKKKKSFESITIKNIFSQKAIICSNNILYRYKKKKLLVKTLLLSVYYMRGKLISDYIAIAIQANKKHLWALKAFVSTLEVLFLSNLIKIKGLRVRLAGKLNGKMRRSKYSYQLGKVELQSLMCYLTYSISLSHTKFGVIATKVWLLNDNFKI